MSNNRRRSPESMTRSLDDEAVSVFNTPSPSTDADKPSVPARLFTAPSPRDYKGAMVPATDKFPTSKTDTPDVEPIIDAPKSPEVKDERSERLARALGSVATNLEQSDIDYIYASSNASHSAFVERYANGGVGNLVETNDELKSGMETWVKTIKDLRLADEALANIPASASTNAISNNKLDSINAQNDADDSEPRDDLGTLTVKGRFGNALLSGYASMFRRTEKQQAKYAALSPEQKIRADKRVAIYSTLGATAIGFALNFTKMSHLLDVHSLSGSGIANSVDHLKDFINGDDAPSTDKTPGAGGVDVIPGKVKPPLVTPDQLPGNGIPSTPEQMRAFFEKATDPATRTDKLGINDFNHPIRNGNDPIGFKADLAEQLRGNSHELARYLSEAKIPGAPLESDYSGNQAGYVKAINDYAIVLDGDEKLHFNQYTLLAQQFDQATFKVRDIQHGYISDFVQNGQFGIDDWVPPSGTVTEVHLQNGEVILVRNECGQTIKEIMEQVRQQPAPVKYVQQEVFTPQPAPQPAPAPVPARQNFVRTEHGAPTTSTGHGGNHGGGGGEHHETPLASKNEADNVYNHTTDEQSKRGGELVGSGDKQNRQNVSRPSFNASQPEGGANNGSTAPSASESRGAFGQGQQAESGLNKPQATTGSSGGNTSGGGSESSAGSSSGSGSDSGAGNSNGHVGE